MRRWFAQTSFPILLSSLLSGCTSVATDGLYPGRSVVLPVAVDSSVALVADDNERAVPLKIFYPEQGGPYPLIVLSHGTFSSIDRYDLIAQDWAEQGYVVILPQHIDANYGVRPTDYAVMQNVALTRAADMSLLLDEISTIEDSIPALAGKIERGNYVAAGHSIGTQVAMLVTGMQFKTSYDGELIVNAENRYKALVLISDPGKMRLMPEDIWLSSNVPTFMATGTEDYGLMGQRGKATEAQTEVLPSQAKVDRYRLQLEGGDHYFGGLIQKDVDAELDYEGLAIFNSTSTAFLDAYTQHRQAARNYLRDVNMEQATGQRASLEKAR